MTRLKDMTPDERKKWFDKMDDAFYDFLMTLPVRERRKVITNIIIKLKKDGVDFNKLSEDEITDEDIKMAKELWG